MARRAFSQALRLKGGVPYAVVLSAPSLSLCASGSDGEDFLSRLKKKVGEQAKNVKKPDISVPDIPVPDKEEAVITFSGYINAIIDSGIPSQLSWGFMSGFASGYCLKKASKVFAVFVGGAFMGIQALAYKGYIHVNHKKIEADLLEWFDLNGDGVIDSKDAEVAWQLLLDVIAFNIPAGTGFTTGLVMGLRTG